jgi:hypothetical protein
MIRSLSLRTRLAIASTRASGLAPAREAVDRAVEVERVRVPVLALDRVLRGVREPDPARAVVPEREVDADREPDPEREVDPEREPDPEPDAGREVEPEREALVLRPPARPVEPLLEALLRDRVERGEDEPDPLEPEVPRLGCGIRSLSFAWGCGRDPTCFFATSDRTVPRVLMCDE